MVLTLLVGRVGLGLERLLQGGREAHHHVTAAE
jgi:hypothetical protein